MFITFVFIMHIPGIALHLFFCYLLQQFLQTLKQSTRSKNKFLDDNTRII